MRVIAGSLRGKKLKSPKNDAIRPTADRVKESLFNILGRRVFDCRFLDLFSGSGAIGIEAISRGASFTVFGDRDTTLSRENILSCKFDNSLYEVIESDVGGILSKIKQKKYIFDIIFMDPPYHFEQWESYITKLDRENTLSETGILIVETPIDAVMNDTIARLKKYDERIYSVTKLSFYERTNEIVEDSGLSGKF